MMNCFELKVISKITCLFIFFRYQLGLLPSLSFSLGYAISIVFLKRLLGMAVMKLLCFVLGKLKSYVSML